MSKNKRVVVFGGSFNPPGIHHLRVGQELQLLFDIVLIYPCGVRPEKASNKVVSGEHRRAMVNVTFDEGFWIDSSDIDRKEFLRTFDLDALVKKRFESRVDEVWHAIGADLVRGGAIGQSAIHTSWYKGPELWETGKFLVLTRGDKPFDKADLPPNSELLEVNIPGSSTDIREAIKAGQPFEDLVVPRVAEYIRKNDLYR